MDPEKLKNLIKSDQQASALINAANDHDCAIRCSDIAPPITKYLPLSMMGIINLYQNDIAMGGLVVATLKQIAQNNPIIAELVSFMGPATQPDARPDFGLPIIREKLVTPVEYGGLGLTTEQAAPILLAGETKQIITPLEIEYIRTRLWQQ